MDFKQTTRSLIEESLNGNFRTVFDRISTKKLSLETSSSVKIMVAICNACHINMKKPENLNESDLVMLAKCLLKFIQLPKDAEYESYSQSVFYIIKFLIEKKSYECIISLQDLIIPEFMPSNLSDKHKSIHENTNKTIYNAIVRLAQSRDQNCSKIALKLSYLLTATYKKLDQKPNLLESANNCFTALIMLNLKPEDLLHFYKFVLTQFDRVVDNNLYSLFLNNLSLLYSHFLKNEKYELAETCCEATTSHLHHLFRDPEFRFLTEILNVIAWLNPVNLHKKSPEKAHSILKAFHRSYSNSQRLQTMCELISSVSYTAAHLLKKSSSWLDLIEHHLSFYKMLVDVALIMAKIPHKCSCRKCSTSTNISESVRSLDTLGILARSCITQRETPRAYKLQVLKYLEKKIEFVSILKRNNCEKWSKSWYNCCVHLYTIGLHLHQIKDPELGILFLQKFVKALLELEGLECKIVDRAYLVSALHSIADAYYDSQDWEKCLVLVAFGISCSENFKNLINPWIKAKSACRTNIDDNRHLQELTLVSICEKYEHELSVYLPKSGLNLTEKRKIDLLLYELKQYKLKWKTKIPMFAAFKELTQLCTPEASAEIFVEIWGDGDLHVDPALPKLLHETIKKFKTNDDFLLAHLYFLQHKYRVKDTIVKHCDDMERTMSLAKTGKVVDKFVPPEPEDQCDLNSNYESLKLSQYTKMMQGLNQALEMLQAGVAKNLRDFNRDRVFKLLANIGHEFALHGDGSRSLQAWETALIIARLAESPRYKLQAIAAIIEFSNVRKPQVQKLIQEADDQLALLGRDNLEDSVVYHLNKSQAYFFVDFSNSYSAFLEARKLSEDFQADNLLQARVFLMHHKFIMLPCKFEVEGHSEFSLVKIHQALNCINQHCCESLNTSSYDMRIFFDIYEGVALMYKNLGFPRELRCYAKDGVLMAQKMLLPIRSTALLYFLAYSDIITCRFDDARSKINDLHEILDVSALEKENRDVQIIVEDMNNLMLDPPQIADGGSPGFGDKKFKLPDFLNHEQDCVCFCCGSCEYHLLILKRTFLKGLLHEFEDKNLAKDFFCGVMRVFEILKKKQAGFLKKVSRKITTDLVPDFHENLVEIYCFTLLEYGNSLLRKLRLVDCKKINQKLLSLLENRQDKFVHLYNEVLLQKINLILCEAVEEKPLKVAALNVEKDEVLVKTPISKLTHIRLSPDVIDSSLDFKLPVKIFPKNLKFDSDDDEVPEAKSQLPKNLPPSLKDVDSVTPAPSTSKIKIYSGKSSRKVKAYNIPSSQSKAVENCTPSAPKVDLSTRTKLLTERLKNSNRKVASGENATSVKKVRQNLFDSETSGDANTVLRRSTRNRK